MKNILHQKPTSDLNARQITSINFVNDQDIKGKKVLDIGCGFGWSIHNFLGRGVKDITGIEISKKDLEPAFKNINSNRVKLIEASAIKLPFEDASFDTVVCWEVIEHIPKHSEQLMFDEVYRVLKPKGNFYLSTPFAYIFTMIMDPAWWLIGHRHYSKKQLELYAQNSNFISIETQVRGGLWTVLGILNMYISKWIFKRHPFFSKWFGEKEIKEYSSRGYANIFFKSQKNSYQSIEKES
ncbi:MAG: hypothetical protein NVSMB46_06380 [Candidatus Saccharimonadales bacterium]